ncbi:hypothetical protein HanHA89_Chr05g0202821 [Helianthus annuus]|nr:hypothetical protein HanHA89_Chr05g0202821 [Helianthus annuus]
MDRPGVFFMIFKMNIRIRMLYLFYSYRFLLQVFSCYCVIQMLLLLFSLQQWIFELICMGKLPCFIMHPRCLTKCLRENLDKVDGIFRELTGKMGVNPDIVSYNTMAQSVASNVYETPNGSRYWTPVVPPGCKPVLKARFNSMEAAIAMYESYAQLAGFCTVAGKHRKGCNCKKLMCQKKYYECYQGCSHRGVMVQFVSDSRKLLVLEVSVLTRILIPVNTNLWGSKLHTRHFFFLNFFLQMCL